MYFHVPINLLFYRFFRYGICVNFYRPIGSKSINKSEEVKDSNQEQLVSESTEGVTQHSEDVQQQHNEKRHSKSSKHRQQHVLSLTSFCIISHHPFFSTFRECLFVLKRFIEYFNDGNNSSKKVKR